jgi:DNA-directed RNA polymerase subunit RPC12/RpoP
MYDDLEKLANLKNKGIITEEEFKLKKSQILNSVNQDLTDNFFICSDCGGKVREGSSFCPNCKVLVTNTIPTTNNVYNNYICPKCGSDRITKGEVFELKKGRSRSGGGIGCLLWIIIFLICPLFFLLFWGVVGYSIYEMVKSGVLPFLFLLYIGILFLVSWYKNNYYICERCGHRFRMKN